MIEKNKKEILSLLNEITSVILANDEIYIIASTKIKRIREIISKGEK